MGSAYADLLTHPGVAQLFGAPAVLQAMLRLERELVLAQAELGLVSHDQAQVVAACCVLDPAQADALVGRAAVAGSLAIPLVDELRQRVGERQAQAVGAVHLGATSQDLIDTAMSLQGRLALEVIDEALQQILRAILRLQEAHGNTPLLARTLMQPAAATVFEARLLNWALPLQRCREQLAERARQALTLQLAGPVGDGAAWGAMAVALRQAVAHRLSLPLHPWAWQVQRDEVARLAAELGVLVGALAKVAVDVALMSQAEVGELRESPIPGRGGSSSMPHKANPVGAMVALSALHRAPARVASVIGAMAQPQERALGGWQAEGAELAELFSIAAASAQAMAQALEQAVVDPQRMLGHLKDHLQDHLQDHPQDHPQDHLQDHLQDHPQSHLQTHPHGALQASAGQDGLRQARASCWAALAASLDH